LSLFLCLRTFHTVPVTIMSYFDAHSTDCERLCMNRTKSCTLHWKRVTRGPSHGLSFFQNQLRAQPSPSVSRPSPWASTLAQHIAQPWCTRVGSACPKKQLKQQFSVRRTPMIPNHES
jgi:hypothetical protein